MNNHIQIYTTADGQVALDVSLDKETVWLTQAQMALLFDVQPQNITMHLKNVFAEGELEEQATCKDFLQVQIEGKREVQRKRKYYNLDAIISVGYRVSSARATQFRIWATATLKQYLVQGYTLNQKRLQERGVEFEQAVALLSRTLSNQGLVDEMGVSVLSVVRDYARSWSLLQAYDEQSLQANTHKQNAMRALDITQVLSAIGDLKQSLIAKGGASELFAQPRGDGLASAIAVSVHLFIDRL